MLKNCNPLICETVFVTRNCDKKFNSVWYTEKLQSTDTFGH